MVHALLLAWVITKSGETTAKGLATIENGDVPKARELAIKNALKQCIGQVAGEWIESRFTADTRESTSKKGTEFQQRIEDSVRVDVQGFVEAYKVIDERKTASGYEVTVSAVVNTKKLTGLMEGLAAAIEKAGRKPRVVMAVQEKDLSSQQAVQYASGFVQQQLIEAGLDLLESKTQWDKLAAQKRGADLIVWVEAEYKNLGKIGPEAEFEALIGQTRSEVRLTLRSQVVRADKMLSSKPIVMTSIGTDYGRSLQRALQGTGNNAVRVACHDFFTQLKDALEQGAIVSGGRTLVVVRKVGSYKTQGKPLVALIEKLDGVSSVQEGGFNNGELKLTIEHGSERRQLEKALLDYCERLKWCKTLDKVGAEGDQLILSY